MNRALTLRFTCTVSNIQLRLECHIIIILSFTILFQLQVTVGLLHVLILVAEDKS